MKKAVKTLGVIIGLPILYMVVSSLVMGIYTGIYIIVNNINMATLDINNLMVTLTMNNSNLIILTNLIMLILLFLIFLSSNKSLISRCNFNKINFKDVVNITLLSVGLSLFSTVIIELLIVIFPSYKEVSDGLSNTINSSIFGIVAVVIVAPIFEEIFFRGVIFGFLKNNFNIVIAVIVQALVFGIIHGNIVQGIYTFGLGIICAVVYIYSKSIYGPIIVHMIFNLFGGILIPKFVEYYPNTNMLLFVAIGIVLIIYPVIKIIGNYETELFQ